MAEPLHSTHTPAPSGAPWVPIAIGAVLVLAVVGAAIWMAQPRPGGLQPGDLAPDALREQVRISDVRMYTAQNFIGGLSIYIEGNVTNQGQNTITGATTQLIFRNDLNEVIQLERVPLQVVLQRVPAIDVARLSDRVPLRPGETRIFRLAFEHISAEWNRNYPEVELIAATVQQ